MAKVKNISKRVFNSVKPGGIIETDYPEYFELHWFEILDKNTSKITPKTGETKTKTDDNSGENKEKTLEDMTISELKNLAETKNIEIPKEITRKADIIEFIEGLDD